ncbi:hypothetical protein KIK84_01530 [Curvibacter sp. CHRR-16]|uniref:hypothetical protein n=1 Tax=Curvibacter sp. CHRR-16 TaxID=2835872 RepID=UPI001BDB0D71|nr:hypothetical protein [Curvibacter sp. CHRR-16]MBT0568996.1 hypothetical protein [Curvibacter sp. CHRR-16]
MFTITTTTTCLQVGKYLLSPFVRQNPAGHFTASLSIRRGQGRSTHDRVMRFVPEFSTQDAALRYAQQEANCFALEQQIAFHPASMATN